MPRRTSARTVSPSATPQAFTASEQIETPYDSNIRQLRRHWKWAAFSQFFFTFSPLVSMSDVTLVDVENDLAHSTNRVLSRVMQRLLITLTQDRKITTESWQNTLRRQYQRKDPEASPIGLMARSQHATQSSRASTAPERPFSEVPSDEPERQNEPLECDKSSAPPSPDGKAHEGSPDNPGPLSAAQIEEDDTCFETPEASDQQTDWLDLSMLAKLDSLHTLAEWQFHNPNRLRQQMKTDDEQATWRIEPIGYDAKRNAYWFIGGDRLWIQREPPRLNPRRKRKPSAKERSKTSTAKRLRTDPDLRVVGQPSVTRSTRSKAESQPSPGLRGGRAAKIRANQRLDVQAKDLAEFRRQMSCARASPIPLRKPTGVRVSARLRGTAVEDDEWQEVPEEWLAVNNGHRSFVKNPSSDSSLANKQRTKTGLESDISSISELTELSDGQNDEAIGPEQDFDEKPEMDTEGTNLTSVENDTDMKAEDAEAKISDLPVPDDFVEWETICVTLEEWESIGQQFEKATHYAEKALYKALMQNIVPMVTVELREVEKKRRMEDAVVHRKRSSRIAMKEIEKEEERAATRRRVEEEEKMSRARRLEARHQREQLERLRRENAREQRRKERELREQQSAETSDASKLDASEDIVQEETNSNSLLTRPSMVPVVQSAGRVSNMGSGTRSPAENWELDCEICGRRGINQDDGVPLLCCGKCGKWQHIICHDNQDSIAGRPKRNWDAEDFVCQQCYLRIFQKSATNSSTSFLSLPVDGKRGQASNSQYGQSSNHPRNYTRNGCNQDSLFDARYPSDQSDIQTSTPSYASQTQSTSVTFAHYQPQQGGFSTSRPTYSVHDANLPPHARYTLMPHTTSATGMTSYSSTLHPQTANHSPTHIQEQWHSSASYPRNSNSYPINGGPPLHPQGVQPYYNGHGHTSYSHMRGATDSMLGQYAGFQHVPSYQHSK